MIKALEGLGYARTRQVGSHVRLSCLTPAQRHVTVPLHDPLRIDTLAGVLASVAAARGESRDDLVKQLFG